MIIWNSFIINRMCANFHVKIIIFNHLTIYGWSHNDKNFYNLWFFGAQYHMVIKKQEFMLNNSLSSFKICKQN